MESRRLGHSGLRVPALSFGTATFGGGTEFFKAWGSTDSSAAGRLIDLCLDHGVSMFDSADVYSKGLAEEILGQAIKGKRNRLLISTKATFKMSDEPNDFGSSRQHLIDAVDKALVRLGTDYIDLFQLHGQDYNTPVEETLATLDQIVRSGKVRYIGASNFAGWHLMKSLAVSDRYGYPRHVAHQAYYSLLNRDYEWELMQLGARPGRRRRHLEPARLGQADRQDPARPAGRARHQGIRHRRHRPAIRRRAAVPDRRRPRPAGRGNRQVADPDRPELAFAAADRVQHHHRRAQRGAAPAEPRRRRLEPDRRSRSQRWTRPATRRRPIRSGTSVVCRN